MELISIGFLLGVIFSLIVFGAGAIYGSRHNDNSDISNNANGVGSNTYCYMGDDLK